LHLGARIRLAEELSPPKENGMSEASTTIFRALSGNVDIDITILGEVQAGDTIDFSLSFFDAYVGEREGFGSGFIWIEVDAEDNAYDYFDAFDGFTVTSYIEDDELGLRKQFYVNQGTLSFSQIIPANEVHPFEHVQLRYTDADSDFTLFLASESAISIGAVLSHADFNDSSPHDPDIIGLNIHYSNLNRDVAPELPTQFTVEQKEAFDRAADSLDTLSRGLGVASSPQDPGGISLKAASWLSSRSVEPASSQVGFANSAILAGLSLTNALITRAETVNPVTLTLSAASGINKLSSLGLKALAADPPDSGYDEVFDASGVVAPDIPGASDALESFLSISYSLFRDVFAALAAAERYQGADLANDAASRAAQDAAFSAALASYESHRVALADALADVLDEIADSLAGLDFEDETTLADVQAYLAGLADPANDDLYLSTWVASMLATYPGLAIVAGDNVQSTLDGVANATVDPLSGSIADALADVASDLAPASNRPPVANHDEAFVDEFDSVQGNVIAGDAGGGVADSDADLDALVVSALDGGTVGQPLAGFRGTLTLNADGSYIYVADHADPMIVGTTVLDAFTYTLSDGTDIDTATLTITITGAATGTGGDEILIANDLGNQLSGLGGADTLIGGAVADTLIGGTGDDSLDGGADADTADYSAAVGAVTVNLSLAGPQLVSVSQGSDTLVSIENIVGSGLGDTLTGNGNANRIDAGNGGDTVAGLGGDDLLIGGTGPDSVDGGADNDTIAGGIGNDTLIGGAGNDTADYSSLNGAVTVNLSTTIGQVTGLGTDTISLFENIVGGIGNDKFVGTTGANRMEGANGSDQLNGLGGADTLLGGSGNDNLQGGTGNDTIVGGAGRDIMVGGGDSDTFLFESASDSAVGGQRDRINDFVQSVDKIDVELIDAMTGGADDDFAFIGTGAFSGSGTQGELRYFQLAGPGQTIVEGDIDGNGTADFQIAFVGLISFANTDFLGV
jgi:VCBS repeat-containing protein